MLRMRIHSSILISGFLALFGQSGLAFAQISLDAILENAGLAPSSQAKTEYDHCVEQWNRDGAFYDCDCVKENAASVRQQMSDDTLKRNQKKIANLEREIESAKAKIANTDKPSQIESLESTIASYEQSIAKYSTPTDPESYLVSDVMLSFDDSGMCRDLEGARNVAFEQCMNDAKSKDTTLNPERCSCEADAVAKAWGDAKGLASVGRGKIFNMVSRKARRTCK